MSSRQASLEQACLRIARRISSIFVNRNSLIFNAWYGLTAQPPDTTMPPDHEADPIVRDLRTNGIAVMRRAFSETFVRQFMAALSEGIARSREAFEGAPAELLRIDRPDLGIIHSQNFLDCGRQMTDWIALDRAPEPIRIFAHDFRFRNIVRRYYGVDGESAHVNGVCLTPCPTDDVWHIDSIFDQLKVMLCVSEVTRDNGPMIYKLGTHDHPPSLRHWYFNAYRHGKANAYGGKDDAYRAGSDYAGLGDIQAESFFLTGEPGDCFLFDSRGVHKTAACRTGECHVAFSGFGGLKTRRNLALLSLKKPGITF